jgi:uncharacterized protein
MSDQGPAGSALKQRIQEDMKSALRTGDKRRLGVVRLILAAVKQREIDERIVLDDNQVVAVLEKMIKQRHDSLDHFRAAGRQDLVAQEAFEVEVVRSYMPEALGPEDLALLIEQAIRATGASSARDMGKVMAALKQRVQGRADMGQLGAAVKNKLGAKS